MFTSRDTISTAIRAAVLFAPLPRRSSSATTSCGRDNDSVRYVRATIQPYTSPRASPMEIDIGQCRFANHLLLLMVQPIFGCRPTVSHLADAFDRGYGMGMSDFKKLPPKMPSPRRPGDPLLLYRHRDGRLVGQDHSGHYYCFSSEKGWNQNEPYQGDVKLLRGLAPSAANGTGWPGSPNP